MTVSRICGYGWFRMCPVVDQIVGHVERQQPLLPMATSSGSPVRARRRPPPPPPRHSSAASSMIRAERPPARGPRRAIGDHLHAHVELADTIRAQCSKNPSYARRGVSVFREPRAVNHILRNQLIESRDRRRYWCGGRDTSGGSRWCWNLHDAPIKSLVRRGPLLTQPRHMPQPAPITYTSADFPGPLPGPSRPAVQEGL